MLDQLQNLVGAADIFLLQHDFGVPIEYNAKNLTHQKAKVFDMYSGDEYTVRLRVQNRLADAVIDKFGKETIMTPPTRTTSRYCSPWKSARPSSHGQPPSARE